MSEKMNPLDFLADQYVICICEGTAEEVIMETLLDNHCLILTEAILWTGILPEFGPQTKSKAAF